MQTSLVGQRVAEERRCWVVQPNFDVIVYLDRASAPRLAFIERIAARRPSQGATTLYHLTRETVYAALESGIEPRTLVETLAQGAEHALPANVEQTLADWAARRERLTVYPQVDIVEFADAQARDTALARNRVHGVPIGDRFVRLASLKDGGKMVQPLRRKIDYHASPTRCVRLAEDGSVQLQLALADLLVQGELACWAESEAPDGIRWRITHAECPTGRQRRMDGGTHPGWPVKTRPTRYPSPAGSRHPDLGGRTHPAHHDSPGL